MIRVNNLYWKYWGSKRWALKNVSFDLDRGEALGIVGPSGAGKSTLCLALNGLIPHRVRGTIQGHVFINGIDTREMKLRDIVSKVGLVSQDPDTQLVTMSVWDEIAFTLENFCYEKENFEEKIERILKIVGLKGLEHKHPFDLSAGQKQRLVIASILVTEPEIMVLDEPTSNLDPVGRKEVFNLLLDLKKKGYTMVIVEHETDELMRLVDKLLILDNGEVVAYGDSDTLFKQIDLLKSSGVAPPQIYEFLSLIKYDLKKLDLVKFNGDISNIKKVLSRFIKKTHHTPSILVNSNETQVEEIAISINDLHFVYPDGTHAIRGINLKVNSGDFLAIVGQNGSGKTTLAKIISGLLSPTRGIVKIFGRDIHHISRTDLVKLVGCTFQNPDHQLFSETVWDELAFGPSNLGLPEEEIERRVKEIARKLGLENYLAEHPFYLSKGLRLRIAVGSILTMKPKIIIVDEPTTGQDWRESIYLMNLLVELNNEGKTIIFLTHHMRYVAEFAKRVIVVKEGKIILDSATREAFTKVEILKSAFAEPPVITTLTYDLFKTPALTVKEAAELFFKLTDKNTFAIKNY